MAILIGTVGGVWGVSGAGVTGTGLAYEIWQLILPGIVEDVDLLAGQPDAQQEAVDKWTLICNSVATGVGTHLTLNAQTIEAANQAVLLKDRLSSTNNLLASLNTNLNNTTTQLANLFTGLAAAELDNTAVNANILTLITAWQLLNTGLSAPDPSGTGAIAAAAVVVFNNTLMHPLTGIVAGTAVPSWTSLVVNHTARSTAMAANAAAVTTLIGLIASDQTAIAAENPLLAGITVPTSDGII